MFGIAKAAEAPHRRYVLRTLAFMGAYVALNVAAIAGAFDDLQRPGAWLFAVAVSAPIAGQMWATLALMNEADEFVRALTAKRFIITAGLAMALFSTWGFAESFAEAPHAPGWLIYPLFWGLYGLVSPFVRSTGQ